MMLFTSKCRLADTDLLVNLTDNHCHILPGVDDGVRSEDEALRLLSRYEELGIKKVVFTPHVMEDFPRNNSEFLRAEFLKFKSHYSGGIELSLAAEYMLDNKFEMHLSAKDMLTFDGNYLLVETSYFSPPLNLKAVLQEIASMGYFVVLAHPERYGYMREEDYLVLKELNVMFQLNLMSLSGFYGKSVQQRAENLLEKGMCNLIGTDIHSLGMLEIGMLRAKFCKRVINKLREIKR